MAISLVGTGYVSQQASGSNAVTVDISGAGIQANDVIIAIHGGSRTWGASSNWHPSGFTEAYASDGTPALFVSYKVAAGSESSIVFPGNATAADSHGGFVYILRGVDTTNPVGATPTTASSTTPAAITTSSSGDWVIDAVVISARDTTPGGNDGLNDLLFNPNGTNDVTGVASTYGPVASVTPGAFASLASTSPKAVTTAWRVGGVAWTPTVGPDAMGLTDVTNVSLVSKVDDEGLTDSRAINIGMGPSDSMGVTDATIDVVQGKEVSISDNLGLTDATINMDLQGDEWTWGWDVNISPANSAPPAESVVLLAIGDVQTTSNSADLQRVTDNMALARATAHDYAVCTGDYVDGWLDSQVADFDADFNTGSPNLYNECWLQFGNHDTAPDGTTYSTFADCWGYFPSGKKGASATAPWWSFDTSNGWHIIGLIATSSPIPTGSLASGSTQYNWLSDDLDANTGKPTLVFWHWGRYSASSAHGSNTDTSDAFALLLTHPQVEAVISGHQHHYERFARMNNAGAIDATNGIRQFTLAATGQVATYTTNDTMTGLQAYANSLYSGVTRFTLYSDHYEWDTVVPEGYNAITDTGSQDVRT